MAKQLARALTVGAAVYHLTAYMQDNRRAKENWNRLRDRPSGANLRRLLLAQGESSPTPDNAAPDRTAPGALRTSRFVRQQ